MLTHMEEVATFVDSVFPERQAGAELKQYATKLCSHVTSLTQETPTVEKDTENVEVGTLVTMASRECKSAFKALAEFRLQKEEDDKTFDSLSVHARELFRTLVMYHKGV